RQTCLFFFFQAEDGIRDWSVTGVQTCALPICAVALHDFAPLDLERERQDAVFDREVFESDEKLLQALVALEMRGLLVELALQQRSEERRVGKEWRCRWSLYH